jgi:hypothetical protein
MVVVSDPADRERDDKLPLTRKRLLGDVASLRKSNEVEMDVL